VTLVPTIAREQVVVSQQATGRSAPAEPATAPVASSERPSRPSKVPALRPLPGKPAPVSTKSTEATVIAKAGPCADRRLQVIGDPYSPPCIAWSDGKDNGGATSRGVTKDVIRVSFRVPVEKISDFQSVLRQVAGDKGQKVPLGTDADFQRTVRNLITYFGRNFQTYGRTIEVVIWQGKGSIFQEFQGAGQEAAQADAIRAAKELKVFADFSAFTQPYNDALARQGVVAIGAPYLSQQWFKEHEPYSWSPFPDCTSLFETTAHYLNSRVFGHPADRGGAAVVGKPRKVALITAENPEYQQCMDAAFRILDAAGNRATRYSYTVDIAALSNQANNLAAKLKQDGITTVVLLTDALLPLLMTARMSQQKIYPEWVVTGIAFTDFDELGQLYDQAQWKNAFGISQLGEQQAQAATYGYAAAKSVDPDDEPGFVATLVYNFAYQLAIGIHMAGPNLTAQSFAAGMRAYPQRSGPQGTWGYPQGAYSPYRDAREIWWDPNAVSVANGAPGRYASTNRRYPAQQWPKGPAAPQQLQILNPDKAIRPRNDASAPR